MVQTSKETQVLDSELQMELKIFLAGKPAGYTFQRAFIRDAVREKLARMKAETKGADGNTKLIAVSRTEDLSATRPADEAPVKSDYCPDCGIVNGKAYPCEKHKVNIWNKILG